MKTLAVLSALFITLHIYAQKTVSYENGMLLKGSDTLSLSEFKGLCKEAGVKLHWNKNGSLVTFKRYTFHKGKNQLRAGKSVPNTVVRNISLFAQGATLAGIGVAMGSWCLNDSDLGLALDISRPVVCVLATSSGVMLPIKKIKTKKQNKKNADKYFKELVKRYNFRVQYGSMIRRN